MERDKTRGRARKKEKKARVETILGRPDLVRSGRRTSSDESFRCNASIKKSGKFPRRGKGSDVMLR